MGRHPARGLLIDQPRTNAQDLITEHTETKAVHDERGNLVRRWKSRTGTPEHVDFGVIHERNGSS